MTKANRFFLCLLLTACCLLALSSCTPPIPIYFDKPLGIKVQGFDTIISGNYLPLDDILDKSVSAFSDRYTIKYDKIILKDTGSSIEKGKDINYEEIKDIVSTKDSPPAQKEVKCDSSIALFNKLAVDFFGPRQESRNDVAGIIKIMYDKVISIVIDSTGSNYYDTLVRLDTTALLTKYSGKYFLNFKTPFGWEIVQMEVWENKFLSARPLYFTHYDQCAQTPLALTASTKNIYPNLVPIVKNKKVVGFKAVLNPKLLLEAFKRSEETLLMVRLK